MRENLFPDESEVQRPEEAAFLLEAKNGTHSASFLFIFVLFSTQ